MKGVISGEVQEPQFLERLDGEEGEDRYHVWDVGDHSCVERGQLRGPEEVDIYEDVCSRVPFERLEVQLGR